MCRAFVKPREEAKLGDEGLEFPTQIFEPEFHASVTDIMDDMSFLQDLHISQEVYIDLQHKIQGYYGFSARSDILEYEIITLNSLLYLTSGVIPESDEGIDELKVFLSVMVQTGCETWISLNQCRHEKQKANNYFVDEFGISGVIGCIDRIEIEIDGSDQFLRPLVVCDQKRRLRHIDCSGPEFTDDCVWMNSHARKFLLKKQNFATNRLIADRKFTADLCLVLPYQNPPESSLREDFNSRHDLAGNIMKETMKDLKCQFKCLAGELPFESDVAELIFKVCCAIYNMHIK